MSGSSSLFTIPKPAFDSCDETSLKLKWGPFDTSTVKSIRLQYKEVHEAWDVARDIIVSNSEQEDITLTETDVVDLKPGTPYFVRLAVEKSSGDLEYGPETVFDTKPVDCTPKRKTCEIS